MTEQNQTEQEASEPEFVENGHNYSMTYSIGLMFATPQGFTLHADGKVTFNGFDMEDPPSIKLVRTMMQDCYEAAGAFQTAVDTAVLRWAYKNNQPLKINPARGFPSCVQAVVERLGLNRSPIVQEFNLEHNKPTDEKPYGDTPVGVLLSAEFFDADAGAQEVQGFTPHLVFYSITVLPMIPNYETQKVDYDYSRAVSVLLDGDVGENIAKTHAFLDNPPFQITEEEQNA